MDITALVANAECKDFRGWQHHNGEEAGTSNTNFTKNVELFNSNEYSGLGIESWTGNPQTDKELIFQTIELPAGDYEFDACVVAQEYVSDTEHGNNTGGIFLFIGDKKVECTSNVWKRYKVKYTQEKDGVVQIGVKADGTNKNTWICLADVHLMMMRHGTISNRIALDENNDTYVMNKGGLAHFSLQKYLPKNRYTTLCLPFALDNKQCASLFSSIKSIEGLDKVGTGYNVTTKVEKSMEAGKVYIVKAKKALEYIDDLGIYCVSAKMPTPVQFGTVMLYGTYHTWENKAGSYILNNEGTAFIPSNGKKIKGYGGFIKTE